MIDPNIIWTRFRIVFVSAPSAHDTLNRLARALELELWPLSSDDQATAASYLRRLARSPEALDALSRPERGRPQGSGVPRHLIAVDYLARIRLKKWTRKQVRIDTAKAWRISPDTVKDSVSRFRAYAVNQIHELSAVGTSEPSALDAIVGSLADHRKRLRPKRGNKSR